MGEYEASNLSQSEYCEQYGHSFRQFKYYRNRFSQLSKSTLKKIRPPSNFAPVSLVSKPSLGLRIELGCGAHCLVTSESDIALLKSVLKGLR